MISYPGYYILQKNKKIISLIQNILKVRKMKLRKLLSHGFQSTSVSLLD